MKIVYALFWILITYLLLALVFGWFPFEDIPFQEALWQKIRAM
jgi:hypothetical protein